MEYWSIYNYHIGLSDDSFLLYNSFSNAFVELPKSEEKNIEEFIKSGDSTVFSKKMLLLLKKIGAIYGGIKDKQINALKMRYYKLAFSNSKHISFTILPTLGCNFRCSYCFEAQNQVLNSKKMSKEVQDIIVDKLIQYHKKEYKISISWFGGEPLLAPEIISYISTRLNDAGVTFRASMTSNGYLLTPSIVERLEEWNIEGIQVTIDGDEYTHDSRRVLANGGKTYQTIIDNLKYLSRNTEKVNVSIRVNVDKTNEQIYSQIASTLKRELPKMYVYPGFVTEGCNACGGKTFTNHIEKADFYISQYKEYENLCLNYFPRFVYGHCMATNFNSWIIGPDAEMYNCQSEVGLKSKIVGNLKDNEITNMDYISEFMVGISPFENEQCCSCFALPICGGGCPLERLQRKYKEKIDPCSIYKNRDRLGELLKIHYEIKRKNQEITSL